MVGPLPLGAWVAAVGGSVAVATVVRKKQGAKVAAAGPPVLTSGQVPFPDAMPLGKPDIGGPFGLPAAPVGPPAAQPIETNVDWERAATTILIGRGYGAYATQQALRKYLRGLDALTPEEQAIVESALKWIGLPPQPPTTAPAAIPKVLPVPVVSRTPAINYDMTNLPTGARYQVDRRALDDPNAPGEVYASIGGQYYRVSNATAIGAGIPVLEKGWAYYIAKVADAAAGSATIAYMNPTTGYTTFGNAVKR